MKKLHLSETQYTPEIILDSNGIMSITGKSYPENTFDFYKPVMDWMEEYFNGNSAKKTVLNMEIVYFNSSSSKLFFDLFDLLDENKDSTAIEINWIYDQENESAQEAGEDFQDDFEDLNIKMILK